MEWGGISHWLLVLDPVEAHLSSLQLNSKKRWVQTKIVTADIEKIIDSDGNKTCFVFHRDRFAISFPRTGVFIWVLQNGRLLGRRDECAQLR